MLERMGIAALGSGAPPAPGGIDGLGVLPDDIDFDLEALADR